MDWLFFTKVLIGGLLSGVMYSLVALGYVLIFKASGVFNFAQGALVLFAALTFVSIVEGFGSKAPGDLVFWIAMVLTLVAMVAVAIGTERFVLRPLVNQPLIVLFMATLGLNNFLEGAAQGIWGNDVHRLEIGISERPIDVLAALGLSATPSRAASTSGPPAASAPTAATAAAPAEEGTSPDDEEIKIEVVETGPVVAQSGLLVSQFDLFAAATAGLLVTSLALFFNYTRIGRALRAVADDHQAALSVGIPLQHVWAIVWAAAGLVALVAGLLWGSRLGVQFSLSLVVLKALPVLIVGGFTSIAGAIVGGLVIGATEKLAEVYVGPLIGGAIENWFPYAVATLFLLYRPQGLFGEKIIERV
ncbi:MAG: branched-chain amino acid ABC transporter permease [Proteobacteria bacterium]|nr:branched-chain amino acid ABC transporter permease [Pseudomonadota bacterium]